MNLGPKSLNTELKYVNIMDHGPRSDLNVPKKAASLGSNEVDAICVRPFIDFQLLLQACAAQHNNLAYCQNACTNKCTRNAFICTWKPVIMSTVISLPDWLPRFRTGTYAFNSARRAAATSARGFPTSSARRKN